MEPGEKLEQEDHPDQTAHLVTLDLKDLQEKLVIRVIWVHQGRGDRKAHQENQAKMESLADQETLEKLDFQDHREQEDFLVHLVRLA